jgi:hypothetical protein
VSTVKILHPIFSAWSFVNSLKISKKNSVIALYYLVERLVHKTATRLKRAIAIDLVIAWRLMLMTLLGREVPNLPASVIFTDLEVSTLTAYAAKKKLRSHSVLAQQ